MQFQTNKGGKMSQKVKNVLSIIFLYSFCAFAYYLCTMPQNTDKNVAHAISNNIKKINPLILIHTDEAVAKAAIKKLIKHARAVIKKSNTVKLEELINAAEKSLSRQNRNTYEKPYFFIRKKDYYAKIKHKGKKLLAIMAMARITPYGSVIITDNDCTYDFKSIMLIHALSKNKQKYKNEMNKLYKIIETNFNEYCPNIKELVNEFKNGFKKN